MLTWDTFYSKSYFFMKVFFMKYIERQNYTIFYYYKKIMFAKKINFVSGIYSLVFFS